MSSSTLAAPAPSSRWAMLSNGPKARAFGLALLVLLAIWLAVWLMPYGAATSPESINYLEAATSLSRGQGLTLPNLGLDGAARVPMTLWAPLYPVMLAPFIALSGSSVVGGSVANGVLLVCLAVILQLICRRWLSQPGATLCAAVILLLPPLQLIYSYAWSEALCEPLLLLCYYAALRFADEADAPQWQAGARWLVLASIACALAFYARYAAVAFIPILAVTVACSGEALPARLRLARGLAVSLTVSALITPLLWRNLALTGHLSGGDRGGPEIRLGRYLRGLWQSLDHYMLRDFTWVALLLLAAYLLIALAARRQRRRPATGRGGRSAAASDALQRSALLPVLWSASYIAAIAVMSRNQHVEDDARIVSLITPFAVLALLALSGQLRALGSSRIAWIPFIIWMGFSAWNDVETLEEASAGWSAFGTPRFPLRDAESPDQVFNNFTRNPAMARWQSLEKDLQRSGADGVVFIDFAPRVFHFLTGAATRQAPREFDSNTVARLNAIGSDHGALVAGTPATLASLVATYGPQLSGLRRLPVGEGLSVVAVALPLPIPEIHSGHLTPMAATAQAR